MRSCSFVSHHYRSYRVLPWSCNSWATTGKIWPLYNCVRRGSSLPTLQDAETRGRAVTPSGNSGIPLATGKGHSRIGGEVHEVPEGPPSQTSSGSTVPATPWKSTGHGRKSVRIRKKAPWGALQLRDSWCEDAMTKRDTESMNERIHREYRYHPEEDRRRYLKYAGFVTIPCALLGFFAGYYHITGRPLWEGDPQHILNVIRLLDTSPRSKLYAYTLPEACQLPEHVLRHREENGWKRLEAERIFAVTQSAFAKPSEMDLRRLEMEKELAAERAEESD